MIVCDLKHGQGLGNQLWNLAAAHQLAKLQEKRCYVANEQNFKGKDFIDLGESFLFLEAEEFNEISSIFPIFRERLYYDARINYLASGYDSRIEMLKNNVILEGLFQSEKYIDFSCENINELFPLKSGYEPTTLPSGCCILNLRGGEYKRHKEFILPKSYWDSAIAYMKKNRGVEEFIVVTDDSRYASSMFPGFEVISGSISKCYLALMSAQNIVVSNSTFSYFPIRASKLNPHVVGPKYFARFNSNERLWASPANLYDGWYWMDSNGSINTSDECVAECESLMIQYNNEYNVSVNFSFISKKSFRHFMPKIIRRWVKLFLSVLMPRHFG